MTFWVNFKHNSICTYCQGIIFGTNHVLKGESLLGKNKYDNQS